MGYRLYQEYPVSRINSSYVSNAHKFDWVILDLRVVIECHGKQHYEATDFSGKAEDGGLSAFNDLRYRDRIKKQAALDAGYIYIEIPYTDEKKIDSKYIWSRIEKEWSKNEEVVPKDEERQDYKQIYNDKQKEIYKSYKQSKQYRDKLSLARKIAKERYRRLKKFKDEQ